MSEFEKRPVDLYATEINRFKQEVIDDIRRAAKFAHFRAILEAHQCIVAGYWRKDVGPRLNQEQLWINSEKEKKIEASMCFINEVRDLFLKLVYRRKLKEFTIDSLIEEIRLKDLLFEEARTFLPFFKIGKELFCSCFDYHVNVVIPHLNLLIENEKNELRMMEMDKRLLTGTFNHARNRLIQAYWDNDPDRANDVFKTAMLLFAKHGILSMTCLIR